MGFQRIAKTEGLWIREMMGLEANAERVLLVNVDDRIYASADICPHQKIRLSEGTLPTRFSGVGGTFLSTLITLGAWELCGRRE
jgi:hypothetical protein